MSANIASNDDESLDALSKEEASELVGAERYERTAGREAYRSGYYAKRLITGVGEIELSVPKLCGAAGSVEKVGVVPDPIRSESARRPRIWNTVDILCRLDPVRKLEAGLEHLPCLRLEPHPIDGTVDPPGATVVVER